jgi:hypothetical protein
MKNTLIHAFDTLPPFCRELYAQLDTQLSNVKTQYTVLLEQARRSIPITREALLKLEEWNQTYQFPDKFEQTRYLKEIKPIFYGLFLYFHRFYNMELNSPPGNRADQEEYVLSELQHLKAFYEKHKFFYQYIKSEATYLDDNLYIPTKEFDLEQASLYDTYTYTAYPTSLDNLAASIYANDLLQEHLSKTLSILTSQQLVSHSPALIWTESRTALTELAYAFQSAGVFNDGKAELKDIIDFLQDVFSVNLGHYPRTFQEILSRKKGYTTFIDKLRERLLTRIQKIEDKYMP